MEHKAFVTHDALNNKTEVICVYLDAKRYTNIYLQSKPLQVYVLSQKSIFFSKLDTHLIHEI